MNINNLTLPRYTIFVIIVYQGCTRAEISHIALDITIMCPARLTYCDNHYTGTSSHFLRHWSQVIIVSFET